MGGKKTLLLFPFQGVDDEAEIKKEIEEMLEALDIADKRDVMSKSLSGGMKRKLR